MKYFLPSRCLGSPCDYNPFTTHTWANSPIWQPRFFHRTRGRNSTPDSATKEWRQYGRQSIFGPEQATNQFPNPIMDNKQWKTVTYRKNRRTTNYRPNVRSFGRNLGMGDHRYPIPTANNFNHLQDKKEVKEEPKFAKHEKARSVPKANVYSPPHCRPLYPNPQEVDQENGKLDEIPTVDQIKEVGDIIVDDSKEAKIQCNTGGMGMDSNMNNISGEKELKDISIEEYRDSLVKVKDQAEAVRELVVKELRNIEEGSLDGD
ncbi:hypothetical protein SUGI_0014280 [Cryptomeria japonica]|nr:hypothetical protein SUGI_0014280 [Cryptomeria japonica]